MPKVTDQAVQRAFAAYSETVLGLVGQRPSSDELLGMKAALLTLADYDRDHAKIQRVSGRGKLTLMVFDGPDMWAIGEELAPEEAQGFAEDLWGARPIVGEFPPDPDQ